MSSFKSHKKWDFIFGGYENFQSNFSEKCKHSEKCENDKVANSEFCLEHCIEKQSIVFNN